MKQLLLTAQERQQLLVEWNATQHDYPRELCLHNLFETQVERTSDAVALVFQEEQLTYHELNRRADKLASLLQQRGIAPEARVGLLLERSLEMLIALLGVLKAGGAYVPFDPATPEPRLRFICADAQIALLLSHHQLLADDARPPVQVLDLDLLSSEFADEADSHPQRTVSAANLAYVIYTSGSTGQPKGVLISHYAICNLLQWQVAAFDEERENHVLQFASLSFDASIPEIFLALLTGATLYLGTKECLQPGPDLLNLLYERAITTISFPPAVLTVLPGRPLPSLRTIFVGGETYPSHVVENWGRGRRFFNAYGPTETTVCASMAKHASKDEEPSIGRPIANVQMYILDAQMLPVPIGMVGELYIGGAGLARGYLNQPSLTAERFVPHPFSDQPGARLYRTGDLARHFPNGSLAFVGRADKQVKLRGYRIELGEIEAVLQRHPTVHEARVLLREDIPAEKQLVAYVVSTPTSFFDALELRQYLREQLPAYMVPTAFIPLEGIPLTLSGKVDQQALPAPTGLRPEQEAAFSAARTPQEEVLVSLWAQVLHLQRVGIHDSFFELGGHSLLATQLLSRVQATFQLELPLRTLFEAPTVAAFAQRIQQQTRSLPHRPILARHRTDNLLLSFAQQRLWFLAQLDPASAAYHIPTALRLQGVLQERALEQSLQELIQRHHILRTSFVSQQDGSALQQVHPFVPQPLQLVDLRSLSPSLRQQEIYRLSAHQFHTPFDLVQGPLLRIALLRLAPHEWVLLLVFHHIIFDGWSTSVFIDELSVLYNAFARDLPSPLAALPIQYADYACWQRDWLQGERLQQQLAYWREQLRDLPTLQLPTDHPRPAVQRFYGAGYSFSLPASLTQTLKVLSQREGTTLFMTLLAGFATLLARYSGQEDIVVGTPIANRTRPELENVIGFFANTLVLRTDLGGNPSVRELLRRVRQMTLDAYTYQDLPFERLVEELAPARDLSRSPLFQVLFVMQNAPVDSLVLDQLEVSQLPIQNRAAQFDLALEIREEKDELLAEVQYSTDLFEAPNIARLAGHLQSVLEGFVANPNQSAINAPLLGKREYQQIVMEWNTTQTEYLYRLCFHDLFAEQALRTPDAVAVQYRELALTYCELDYRASLLAHNLLALGLRPEDLVGLYLERSLEMLIAILATFKAGGAYVPLDPEYPEHRLRFILEQARVQVIVTRPELKTMLPLGGTSCLCFDPAWLEIPDSASPPLPRQVDLQQLAYVIYTSGSTGQPKGAMVTHHGMLNHLFAKITTLGLCAEDRVAQTASHCFDISVWQFLAALLVGGQVEILEDEQARDPRHLLTQLSTRSISILETVPSLLRTLLEEWELREGTQRAVFPEALRWLLVTGEAFPLELWQRWSRCASNIPVVNAYGPTECSDDVTHAVLHASSTIVGATIPLGRPLINTQIYLLDRWLQPVPIGIPGEVYVGGCGVGRGYVGEVAQTATVFVPDPFSGASGGRLYRTGDRARFLADGNIEFLGRMDEQVKLRGFRIELGEIEAMLGQHPAIQAAVALVRNDQSGEKCLAAYVVLHPQQSTTNQELRGFLKERLPEYMIPSIFIVLDALPLTSNGKIDRQTLPVPQYEKQDLAEAWGAPRTWVEEELIAIWEAVLKRSGLSIYDNFFEVGGHSLLATQLMSRVRDIFFVDLPLRSLFDTPTVAGMAETIMQEAFEQEDSEMLAQMLANLEGSANGV